MTVPKVIKLNIIFLGLYGTVEDGIMIMLMIITIGTVIYRGFLQLTSQLKGRKNTVEKHSEALILVYFGNLSN